MKSWQMINLAAHRLDQILGSDTGNVPQRHQKLSLDEQRAIRSWMSDRCGSPATRRAYAKEIERLLLWCIEVQQRSLFQLSRDDFRDYADFLISPQPAQQWCATKTPRLISRARAEHMLRDTDSFDEETRGLIADALAVNTDSTKIANPLWRPFQSSLSASAARRVMHILQSLMTYLVQTNAVAANPLAVAPLHHKGSMGERSEGHSLRNADLRRRALDPGEWQAVWDTLEQMPRNSAPERDAYERLRFLVEAFYCLGARIGELASHSMGTLEQGSKGWRWYVTGKGGKDAWVPVNSQLFSALMRYRRHIGLSPLPSLGETIPFFMNRRGNRPIGQRQVFNLIKVLFAQTALNLEETAPDKAEKLRRASPHWLRHTYTTHLAEQCDDPILLQRLARHGDFSTTLRYIDKDDERLHSAAELLTSPLIDTPLNTKTKS